MNKSRKFTRFMPYVLVIAAFVLCQLMMNKVFGLSMTYSMKGLLVPICCWIVMAVSLNLVVGVSGELSLGHAGFMSVGAFTAVVVSTWLNASGVHDIALRMILTFIASGAAACVMGIVIGVPVLRLSGDYLAIVTLAFGEIIRNIIGCLYVSIDGTTLYTGFLQSRLPGTGIVNGPAATKLMVQVKDKATGIITRPPVKLPTETGFIVGFILVLFTLFVVLNLMHSRSGRAIMAVRDNRIAAESTGVDVMKYRLMAFVVSATLAGMAGALYGLNITIDPATFSFDQSINVLVYVVLGGIGSISGSIVSATLLTILPEKLRAFSDYRMLVYAVVLIVVMLVTNNAAIRGWLNTVKATLSRKKDSDQKKEGE